MNYTPAKMLGCKLDIDIFNNLFKC